MRLINGATPEILYGEDTNLNGVLDYNENDGDTSLPRDNQDGTLDFGILEYVTVYSEEPEENEDQEGDGDGGGNQGGNANEDEESNIGKINVYSASATVLECLPEVDSSEAQALVSSRQSQASIPESLDWVSEVLDQETSQAILPFLTDKSYQFMVDIAAVGRNGRGYRRVRVIIDMSGERPLIRYRKDLTRSGWALGTEVRQQFASNQNFR